MYPASRPYVGGRSMQHSSHARVQNVAPVTHARHQQTHERVIQGEVLGKEESAKANEQRAGFTIDGRRQDHPGFYSKRHQDPAKGLFAVEVYAKMVDFETQESSSTIDYFV